MLMRVSRSWSEKERRCVIGFDLRSGSGSGLSDRDGDGRCGRCVVDKVADMDDGCILVG